MLLPMANGKMFLALCFFDTSIFIRAEKKKLLKGSIFDETTLTSGNCFDNFGHSNALWADSLHKGV